MPVDLGDAIPLSIVIYDAGGNPANATSVTLTITLPDGTAFNAGVVLPTSTGQYSYNYPTEQVGRHVIQWLATGANASAFSDSVYVQPVDGGEFISLQQFKKFIKKTGNVDDETLRTFVRGACGVIADRVGQVSPSTFVQEDIPTMGYIVLDKRPVIEVRKVESFPGLELIAKADPVTGAAGWTLDTDTGILHLGDRRSYRVTYRSGMAVIPPNYILAALELTAHLWRSSQQNAAGGRPSIAIEETVISGTSYALPYSVRQLLGLEKRPQKGVFVG